MAQRDFREYAPMSGAFNVMRAVYGWMTVALVISAVVAYTVAITPAVRLFLFSNAIVPIVLIVAQFGLVIALSAAINSMSSATATILFLLYSLLTGLTLSSIFLTYAHAVIYTSFFVTAAMFGVMSLYGYFTRHDLSSLRTILMMGLVGLVIAMLVNFFLQSSSFDYVISIVGVVLFTALTAFDVQKIKQLIARYSMDRETSNKVAIIGALTLYLDFINLFLFVLRLMSNNRKD